MKAVLQYSGGMRDEVRSVCRCRRVRGHWFMTNKQALSLTILFPSNSTIHYALCKLLSAAEFEIFLTDDQKDSQTRSLPSLYPDLSHCAANIRDSLGKEKAEKEARRWQFSVV